MALCPVCPMTSFFGGLVGGYFGVEPPKHFEGRLLSAVITATMTGISTIVARRLFGLSLCDGNGNFSLGNIVQVGLITLVMGIIYSIAINFLLNKYVFPSSQQPDTSNQQPRRCCCQS
jgi:hypothetical protein